MPEGHTIHRAALDHAADLAGATVFVSSPQGRFAADAAVVSGRSLERVDAWGKHLFYVFDNDLSIHVHLGLFGKFWRHALPMPVTHHQVRMRIEGTRDAGTKARRSIADASGETALWEGTDFLSPTGSGPSGSDEGGSRRADEGGLRGHGTHIQGPVGFDLTGPTACELVDADGLAKICARLGPDPIRKDHDASKAFAKLARRRSPFGAALMDQGVVAGVGNVYRAEVLFVHGIHPLVPCDEIDEERWDAVWATLVTWLRMGVKDRRIITVDPKEIGKAKSRMTREDSTYVYKQDACRRCGTEIRRWDLAGRWSYACETCQPPRP